MFVLLEKKLYYQDLKKLNIFLFFMVFCMFFFFLWLYRFWCDVVQCANSTVVTAPLSPHFHRKDALVCRNMIHSTVCLVLYGIVRYLGIVSFSICTFTPRGNIYHPFLHPFHCVSSSAEMGGKRATKG